MEDSAIIDLYWQRDQSAISETDVKYGGFLRNISWNILRSHGDAEECVNDTYLKTWNAIPPARPTALQAWLGRIARNLSLDRWKQARAQKRGGDSMDILLGELDGCVPAVRGTEQALEDRGDRRADQRVFAAAPGGEPDHLSAAVLVRPGSGGHRRRGWAADRER